MPFKKVGKNKNVSPSGKVFTDKQVKLYYATDGFKDMDEDISEELDSEEQIDEALKPEVSAKAKEIFKTMIGDRRDKLMKRYGANAEKVAYGRAIAQAKKQLEKPEEEMKDEKLKEMVKAALMNPIKEKKGKDLDGDGDIDSQDYLKARDIAIKKQMQKESSNVNEGFDAVANELYGVNYDKLSPQEQEYVRDTIDMEPGGAFNPDDDEDLTFEPEDDYVDEVKLEDLTFDMIVNAFPDNYQDVHFTRKQPNGEEGNYYRDGINFPNFDDSSTHIGDENAWEDWKNKTMRHYGNVTIVLKPDGKNWFDKVFIDDDKFNQDKDKFITGKMSAMQRDMDAGRSID